MLLYRHVCLSARRVEHHSIACTTHPVPLSHSEPVLPANCTVKLTRGSGQPLNTTGEKGTASFARDAGVLHFATMRQLGITSLHLCHKLRLGRGEVRFIFRVGTAMNSTKHVHSCTLPQVLAETFSNLHRPLPSSGPMRPLGPQPGEELAFWGWGSYFDHGCPNYRMMLGC